MASKFGAEPGDALQLIQEAFDMGLNVEGISFHVGSQCTNFDNYTVALDLAATILNDARKKGFPLKPRRYRRRVPGPLRPHRSGIRETRLYPEFRVHTVVPG